MLVLAQVLLPLALLAWAGVAPPRDRTTWLLHSAAIAALLAWLAVVGIWTVPPWWSIWVYAALWLGAVVRGARQWRRFHALPSGLAGWGLATVFLSTGAYATHEAWTAAVGRRPPAGPLAEMRFPVEGGTFLVLNGGDDLRINAHLKTRDVPEPRFARWRGNGYGVDIVAIDRFGLRASGLLPTDNTRYRIFGWPVLAPCDGTVVLAVDGLPDMVPPVYDIPARLAGNHVLLACGPHHVALAHFRRGSVRVKAGDRVRAGRQIAEVGNSGGSDEPHLHMHVQSPGSAAAPMGGAPIPTRWSGRWLVRGDQLRTGENAGVQLSSSSGR